MLMPSSIGCFFVISCFYFTKMIVISSFHNMEAAQRDDEPMKSDLATS